mgnify:CR=1 FL=1
MATVVKIPDSPEGLEEFLGNKTKLEEAFATPETAKGFIEGYRKAANEKDPELQEQGREKQEKGLDAFLEKNGYEPKRVRRLPGDAGDPVVPSSGNDHIYRTLGLTPHERRQLAATGRGEGATEFGKFSSLADFLSVLDPKKILGGNQDARLKALGEGAGDQGGFLVPEEFRAELLRLALEGAVVRPRARVIPMTRELLRFPAIRETSHASTVYGGITAAWQPEAADVSSNTNEPTFAQVRLTAKKLTAYTVVSNELLADSAISLEAVLMSLFPEAIAYFEDDAFIAGVVAAQPLGILNADALISVAKETGQAATTLVWENIIKMYSRMLPASLSRAVWYAHPDTFPQLMTMSLSIGTGGAAVMLTSGVGGPPAMILGRPLIFTEKAETLGAAGDIVLADLGYYLIGDRQSLVVAASPHVKFINDQIVYRFTQRVDGRPWIDSALTPRNGTVTMSPFVALAARA